MTGRRDSTICTTRTRCSPRRHRTIAPGSRPCRWAHWGHVTSNHFFSWPKKDDFRGHYWMTLHEDQGLQVSCGVMWLLTVGTRDRYLSWPKKDDFWGHYWMTLHQDQGHAGQLWGHVTSNCGDEGSLFSLPKKDDFRHHYWKTCTRIKAMQFSCGVTWLLSVGTRDRYFPDKKKTTFWAIIE
jgi:hypothetical protein